MGGSWHGLVKYMRYPSQRSALSFQALRAHSSQVRSGDPTDIFASIDIEHSGLCPYKIILPSYVLPFPCSNKSIHNPCDHIDGHIQAVGTYSTIRHHISVYEHSKNSQDSHDHSLTRKDRPTPVGRARRREPWVARHQTYLLLRELLSAKS